MYEWDDKKRQSNKAKHGLDFASVVCFHWETAALIEDRSAAEPRVCAIGWMGNVMVARRSASSRSVKRPERKERRMKMGDEFEHPWDDGRESTPEELAWMRPATEVAPDIVRRYRGKQMAPTKRKVTIRLDADLVASLQALGRGWQTRANDALRKAFLEN